MPFVEAAPGVKIYYQDWGDRRPVVFVHGWPLNGRMWAAQGALLPRHGLRPVALDLRGFGQSDKPDHLGSGNGGPPAYDLDAFADDVRAVMEALDLWGAALVGYSLGGAVALRFLARHAGEAAARVDRLILVAALAPCATKKPGFENVPDPALYDEFIAACETDRKGFVAGFARASCATPPTDAQVNWFVSLAMEASPRATIRALMALRDMDLRPDLAAVSVPTAIVHGGQDQIARFEQTASVLQAALPGAELTRFGASGHAIFLDEKERFNAELLRVLG
jgi:pimeloyl-ACP methyl ester carboxylesterase